MKLCIFNLLGLFFGVAQAATLVADIAHPFSPLCANMLMVVHPTQEWDKSRSSEPGLLALMDWAGRQSAGQIESFLLAETYQGIPLTKDSRYFLGSDAFDHTIYSVGGEHETYYHCQKNILLAGGYFQLCLLTSLVDLVKTWARSSEPHLNITYVTDATYHHEVVFDRPERYGSASTNLRDYIQADEKYIRQLAASLVTDLSANDLVFKMTFSTNGREFFAVGGPKTRSIHIDFRSIEALEDLELD